MDYQGTIARGIRAPIIRAGDDLVDIVANCVVDASKSGGYQLHDRDVVAVTEAVLARSQCNYATTDDIAQCVRKAFGDHTVGLVMPILSRNRFSMILKGIAKGCNKLIIQLAYPSDEVGNSIIDLDTLLQHNVNPYSDVFTEDQFVEIFGRPKHQFTGVDYMQLYRSIAPNCEIILANRPTEILNHTQYVINADIHSRKRTKSQLLLAGAIKVMSLDEILNTKSDKHGYNQQYGVLGSNLATDESIKLFPHSCQQFVDQLALRLNSMTGKNIECMVYGDGAFKDPVGGIWELADPVCSPAYTKGLAGQPNEIKLKYIADNNLAHLTGHEAVVAMKEYIANKDSNLVGNIVSQGTTPRQLTDLLGSLADLTSGSGDKGTPIVLIQNYFKNFAM